MLKTGDRVILNQKGVKKWGNQSYGGVGTIIEIDNFLWASYGNGSYTVKWDEGGMCTYPSVHLDFFEELLSIELKTWQKLFPHLKSVVKLSMQMEVKTVNSQ